ncbi:hypothetical protein Trydic_g553 [Trypoxylus dichotomus]
MARSGSTLKRKSPNRPKIVQTPGNVEKLRQAVQRSPRRSPLKQAAVSQLSEQSVAYKMAFVHEIHESDFRRRVDACQVILHNVPRNTVILTSDKSTHFHLPGFVNKQNHRYWPPDNPCEKHETPLHKNGAAVAVTSVRYVHVLQTFVQSKFQQLDGQIWFQQGRLTTHTSRVSFQVLSEMAALFLIAAIYHGHRAHQISRQLIPFPRATSKKKCIATVL